MTAEATPDRATRDALGPRAPVPMILNALSVLRVGLSVELVGFGVLVAIPPTFSQSRAFDVMARYGSELEWGGLYVGVGLFCLLAALSGRPLLRELGCLLCGVAHGTIAVLLWLGSPTATGTFTYGMQMAFAYYVIWREIRDG